jgi:hypothetical protein
MRTVTQRATRDQLKQRAARDLLTQRNNEHLPDGVGGTITGGPVEPIDLMEVLSRGGRGVSRVGAVSGAAQVVSSSFVIGGLVGGGFAGGGRGDHGIALSDGSRISFFSVADAGVLRHDDGPRLAREPARAPVDDDARAPSNGSRVLATA